LLREGQEQALMASAEALARAVAARPGDLPERGPSLFVQALPRAPVLDAGFADWPGLSQRGFRGEDGVERLRVALGHVDDTLYLRLEVVAPPGQRADALWPRLGSSDHLTLSLDGTFGVMNLRLANASSGPLQVIGEDGNAAAITLRGAWEDTGAGYAIEAQLPQGVLPERLGVQVHLTHPTLSTNPATRPISIGTASESPQSLWPLLKRSDRLARPLLPLLPNDMRARLVAAEGWVLAEAGDVAEVDAESEPAATLPWWRRELYQQLLYAADPLTIDDLGAARSDRPEVWQALSGVPATAWRRDRDASRLLLSAAVPINGNAGVRGALLLEREQQTLQLIDRGFGSLIGSTLLVLLAAGGVLLLFAIRLSWRIGQLRNAAETALQHDGSLRAFPRSTSTDEIGDLSRSFARLLDEVAANQAYLRSLAGKLSHELNTPLAIVRGALDNIDPQAMRGELLACVKRAKSGGDRLAAIVRAMSEASRIEQAIAGAETADFDLRQLISDCAANHADLLAPRRLELRLPEVTLPLLGAPDLIAQALDKLIDNARSFTPIDGWIRISLHAHADGYRIAVANCGPLLPASMRGRLFESMVSVRPAQRADGVHLGFGLYLVRLVAEWHRGHVSAEDLLDKSGVEFSMHLRGLPRR
ncbi:MAG: ATP-binding protein, partial [Pseudomarimonas sp.]